MSEHRARPQPVDPPEADVEEAVPPPMQVEAARLLANDARERMRDLGFDDDQIDAWAKTYIAEFGSGGVEELLGWIAERERRSDV